MVVVVVQGINNNFYQCNGITILDTLYTYDCYRSGYWWDNIVLVTFSAADWLENFRMSQQTFNYLCERLRPAIEKQYTKLHQPISVEKRVAITVWYLATPMEYRSIGHLFGVARCTACVVVHETCAAIIDVLLKSYINFPRGNVVDETVEGFQKTWGVPQCCGAIDG